MSPYFNDSDIETYTDEEVLCMCAGGGDIKCIESYTEALKKVGIQPEDIGYSPETAPLVCAAEGDESEAVSKLLELGFGRSKFLNDAFAAAVREHALLETYPALRENPAAREQYGYLGIAKQLLSAGANPDHQAVDGYTPLMTAVAIQSLETVEYLLSLGASVTNIAKSGLTILHIAVIDSQDPAAPDIIRLLIKRGASPDRKDSREGLTALQFAEENEFGNINEVKAALEG